MVGDWVKHAKTDDSLVAAVLLRLSQPVKPPSLSLDWTVRQRRSRAPAKKKKKRKNRKSKSDQTRASPTTPLSWTSGDGSDDLRSKVYVKNEAMSTTLKRPRKKKTLSELREEEILLLKERKKLRKEMETMRLGFEAQKATNATLNRLKRDLERKKTLEAQQRSVTQSLCDNKTKDTEIREIGFPLPDLNLPADGDSV